MAVSITRRRFLSQAGNVALAAGIGGTLLEACGGTTSSGPVTLTYGWWSNGPTKDSGMQAWIKVFENAYPNIKVNAEILSWQDYWNKLQTTVAGGKAYDIIGMAGGMAAPYFDQRVLYDLSKFSDFKDATKNLIPSAVQMCSWNGQQSALPVGMYVPLMGYNKALLQAAGVALPDPVTPMTFDAFLTAAHKLSIKSGSQYTQYAININDLDPLWTEMVHMEGGQVYDNPINPKKMLVNSPEGIKGLTDWQSLYTQNLAVPLAQQGNGPFGAGDIDSLQTDKVAFSRIVLGDFTQIANEKLDEKYGVTPIFSINGKQVTCGNANSFGIFAGSQHTNEAWTFLKWATSPAGQRGFAQVSDIPVEQSAFNDMASYLKPAAFAQTLISAQKGFMPIVMTPKQQYGTDLGSILTDLSTGKLTPAVAAQQIADKGNSLFSS